MSRADTIRDDASGLRIALLVSRYHEEITTPLEAGAMKVFREAGGAESALEVFDCPGAFELAGLAGVAVGTGRFDAVGDASQRDARVRPLRGEVGAALARWVRAWRPRGLDWTTVGSTSSGVAETSGSGRHFTSGSPPASR